MKLLMALALGLSAAFVQTSPPRTIKLGNLQFNQQIEIDWQFRGCFASARYKLKLTSTLKPSVEVKKVDFVTGTEQQKIVAPIALKTLSEWDEVLSSYQVVDASNTPSCTETERVILVLYENGTERTREVLQNCGPLKMWSSIDSLLKKKSLTITFDTSKPRLEGNTKSKIKAP